jgi:hypothetical protein
VIYKAMFDTRSPTWQAFGRAVFFEAAEATDTLELDRLAIAEAEADYPGSTIRIVGIGYSTRAAWDAFNEKKRQLREWQERVGAGVPNKPSDLHPGQPLRGGRFWFLSAKAASIFADLERRPEVLEDRREYCIDDLRSCYELSEEDAAGLYLRIQHVFKPAVEGAK